MAGDVTDGVACATDGSCCGPASPCCPEYNGPVEIRKANASDLDSISLLLASEHLPLAGVPGNIENFHVAEVADTIVGSVGIELYGDYALLRSVAVSQALKGRGIGRRLVTEAMDDAKSRGVRALYLLTTTAESYFPAFGFEKVERSTFPSELNGSEELKGACPATATAMRKSLRLEHL